jgi:multicomponent Na+:H+ antiporter subunit C
METALALVVGGLVAAAVYLLLRRSLVRIVIGLVLLGHAVNLLILTVARPVRGAPPLVPGEATALVPPYADPLPQALILTAIVIGFGLQVFLLVLLKRAYAAVGSDDLDDMRATDTEAGR